MKTDKKKILIIDTSTLFEHGLFALLDNNLFEIKTVKSPDLALVKIIRWNPDLIITSIEVGNISGFDLCLIIKMMPDFAGVPIILFTSSDEKCIHKKAADAGADYYVKKDPKALATIKKISESLLHGQPSAFQQEEWKRQIKNVLLVDDSSTMRKIIRNILISIGIANVVEAENGKDGLEKLAANKIDMIISDWNMPVMNGVEMIKRMRLNQSYNTLPIVMVSAEVQEEIEKAMNLGINDYLRKPFNALDMKQLVAKFSANPNGATE